MVQNKVADLPGETVRPGDTITGYINREDDDSWYISTEVAGKSVCLDKRWFSVSNPPIPAESTDCTGVLALRDFRPTNQQHDHTCGPASLRSIFAYYGQNVSEDMLARLARTTKAHGTHPKDMLRVLRESQHPGHTTRRATIPWCIAQLKKSRPVLILWNDWKGHWVVLIGYDPKTKRLLFADPANRKTGLRVHAYTTLLHNWKTRVGGCVYRQLAIAVA